MPAKRGECDVCHRRHPLRLDGMMQRHLYTTDPRVSCGGSGMPPRPLRFDADGRPDCGECQMYLYGPRCALLTEAIYSVSIEVPQSPRQLYREFFGAYHFGGHKEMR